MVLVLKQVNSTLPMVYLNVETGKPLQNVGYDGDFARMEFFEQFNETLLIKQEDQSLKLSNVNEKKTTIVTIFDTPEAFFSLYEKDIVVSISDGKAKIYRVSDGKLMTDFGDQTIYSKFCLPENFDLLPLSASNNEHYIVNMPQNRQHFLAI